jgi:hypothetical protein
MNINICFFVELPFLIKLLEKLPKSVGVMVDLGNNAAVNVC